MLRLIVGSGRSGTTWVLDALAEANNLRTIFEPLHPDGGVIDGRFAYSYMTSEAEAVELHAMFSSAVDGSLESVWTDYRKLPRLLQLNDHHLKSMTELKKYLRHWRSMVGRYRKYRLSKRRSEPLIKCIRANLMLNWIATHFEARIVLLMRHPGAVVESQLRLAEHWDPFWVLNRYRRDAALMNGPLRPHADFLKGELSRAGALTANWCIENLVPSSQASSKGYCVTFYEELLEQPEAEWSRLVRDLHLQHTPRRVFLSEPSQQAATQWGRGGGAAADYNRSYGYWRDRIPSDALEQIESVLDAFGVGFYRVSEDRPDVRAFTRFYHLKTSLPVAATLEADTPVAKS